MKNQHYHKRSRDLFPKPYSKHYSERFPWKEPDDDPTTTAMIISAAIGFFSPIVFSMVVYIVDLIVTVKALK